MIPLRATRSPARPLIIARTDDKHWWERGGMFNAGVAEYDKQIILLYRAYDDFKISRLGMANSPDGVNFLLHDNPAVDTNPTDEFERIGIEDPRITQIDDTYYIVHTSASYKKIGETSDISKGDYIPWRVRTGMHSTTDFKSFKHWGVILPDIASKNSCLLPERINGAYALYYRQYVDHQPTLKIGYTHDFVSWFDTKTIPWPIPEVWQKARFGLGSQPIVISSGLLVVYHGVDDQNVYRLGLMLFDRQDPSKLLWHSGPILEPEMPYEREGYVPNIVYTCGAVIHHDELWIYYGGADRVLARAVLPMKDIETAIAADL